MHTLCNTKVTAGRTKRHDRTVGSRRRGAILTCLVTRKRAFTNHDIVVRAGYVNSFMTGLGEGEGPMVVPPS